ncbi:nuclear transport factor 2 family protein [Gordonia humi]|uniref:SnoaL-like domain-containing protein n=1 Tax=Gordonia humi TaxID=686429 RepID=A0A840F1K3_9ACTN|nr:nuclear transport factor 2 family protein [Gordonia humi]MBB4137751.1 hypothetical protein [Gordonia humi]
MNGNSDDVTRIAQVILKERQARDRGWWDQMRECIRSDAQIRLSWFRGSGTDFIAASQDMSRRGQKATHRMSPPVVSVYGRRAVVEISTGIEFRDLVGGVEADLTSYARLLYRLEQTSGVWQIISLDPVYERDSLIPTVPGDVPEIDREALQTIRAPYRFLGYYLAQSGYEVSDDLYGEDRPAEVEELYRACYGWAAQGGADE